MGRGAIRGLRQPGRQPKTWQSHHGTVHTSWRAKQRVVDAVLSTFRNGKWPRAQALLKPGSITWQDIHEPPSSLAIVAPSSPAKAAVPLGDESFLEGEDSSSVGSLDDVILPDGDAVPE